MATNAIVTAANLDISKVTFGEIRANKAGGKTVPIKYNGQSLQIRIPKMSYPMGIGIKETDNGIAYTLSATLKGCDHFAKERAGPEVGETGNLYNFLLDLQEKLLKSSVENSVRWFSKKREEAGLRDAMKQFISPSVEKVNGVWEPTGKYPPSFRMKVPVYDGRVSMDVTDQGGKPVEVTLENIASVFPKRVEASVVVSPSVYVSGQGFGVTWRVSYARVSPPQRLTAAQVFADEIEEETRGGSGFDVESALNAANDRDAQELLESLEETPTAPPAPAPAPEPAGNRRRKIAAAI
jgi:hypothetical protein